MSTSAELLERAKASLQRGERDQARRYAEQALELDPASDQAWLWLAGIATEPKDQQKYLANALHHNPANAQARQGLDWLKAKNPELFAPAAATQMLPSGFEPPPASYGSGFSPPTAPAGSGEPAYGGGSAPAGPAGFAPPPAYGSGFGPPPVQGGFAPPPPYGGFVPPLGQPGSGPPAGQGGFGQAPPYGQPVATPMYGPPGAMPPAYGAPGSMPAVYGGPGPYYMMPGAPVRPQGRNIGCVTAYLIVIGLFALMFTGTMFIGVRAMREGPPAMQRDYAAFNEQLSRQFVSIPTLVAVLAGFAVLYIAGAVGVGKRSLWGWYLSVAVLGLSILFSVFTLMGSLLINLFNIILSAFLISVLVRNREVFR